MYHIPGTKYICTYAVFHACLCVLIWSVCQIEERTWQALVAYRSKTLTREIGGEGKELDAAENNLVR